MLRTTILIAVCYITIGGCEDFCEWSDIGDEKHLVCKEGFEFPLENIEEENLTHWSIHSTKVTAITNDDLKNFPELKVIDFSNSGIETIDSDAFISNTKLEEINLSRNKDLKIPNDSPFFHSKSVLNLNLEDTGTKQLSEDVFTEMPNLVSLNLGGNVIEEIEKAIENVKGIKFITLMKDDNIDREILCERTSLVKITFKFYDDNDEEKTEVYDCVHNFEEDEKKDEETTTEKEHIPEMNKAEEETEEPIPEKTTVEPTEKDHSEFCKDEKNIKFTGHIECKITDNENTCELSCPEGTKPDSDFVNPYVCDYNKGEFTPNTTPTCIPDETSDAKLDENIIEKDQKEHEENKVDEKTNNEEGQTTEIKYSENMKNEEEYGINEIIKGGRALDVNKGEMNEENKLDDEKIGESTSNSSSISGSSVVIGIIVVVMVVGALGMGYKYWKNHRGYHNTRTDDVEEGKELKTISVNNKPLVEQND